MADRVQFDAEGDDLRSSISVLVSPEDDTELRTVLRQQASARGLVLGDDVTDYMLKRFARDLGSLMALLERLDRHALRTQRALTIPLLKDMLDSE